jgi:hypothetical protein
MASDYKILGQSAPAATTNTDVYIVPSATKAVVSTIVIANQGATAGTYRLAARVAGEAIGQKNYLAYDVAIPGNDSTTLTLGITLGATDVLTAYCSSASMSVSVFGSEIS